MNALKCDRCGSFYAPLKTYLALRIVMVKALDPHKYPEPGNLNPFPQWNHDLCPKCQDELRDWWVAGRVKRVIIRDATGEKVGIYSTKKIVPKKFEEELGPSPYDPASIQRVLNKTYPRK